MPDEPENEALPPAVRLIAAAGLAGLLYWLVIHRLLPLLGTP